MVLIATRAAFAKDFADLKAQHAAERHVVEASATEAARLAFGANRAVQNELKARIAQSQRL